VPFINSRILRDQAVSKATTRSFLAPVTCRHPPSWRHSSSFFLRGRIKTRDIKKELSDQVQIGLIEAKQNDSTITHTHTQSVAVHFPTDRRSVHKTTIAPHRSRTIPLATSDPPLGYAFLQTRSSLHCSYSKMHLQNNKRHSTDDQQGPHQMLQKG
jgi:hypothetical protein